jgi:rubredoxin
MMGGVPHQSEQDGFVSFFKTGTRATGDYQCASCGYGITLHSDLPTCPMCGGESWEQIAWHPLSRAVQLQS